MGYGVGCGFGRLGVGKKYLKSSMWVLCRLSSYPNFDGVTILIWVRR